jgi:hypothetical protein
VGEVGYENFVRDYATDLNTQLNYYENKFLTSIGRNLREDLTASLKYNLAFPAYYKDEERSSYYFEILPGVDGKLPDTDISVSANVGVYRRDYNGQDRNDITDAVSTVTMSRPVGSKTDAHIGFHRRPVESSYDDLTFYDEKSFFGGLTHKINQRLRGRLNVSYANRDHEEASTRGNVRVKRDDDAVSVNLGADYAARKWLIFHMDYRFERRDSNFSDFDSTENILSFGTTLPL